VNPNLNALASINADADAADDAPVTPSIAEVEENLAALATAAKLPSYTRTRNVRLQFQHAFELIGGIPRLAHWAHQHPTQFYQLYSKLIPAQVTGADGGPLKIELSWLNARDTSGKQSQVPNQAEIIDLKPLEDK